MERDLVTDEGVDEGSAAGTAEGEDAGGEARDPVGSPPGGGPAGEQDPAPPLGEVGADGQGQSLEVGEG